MQHQDSMRKATRTATAVGILFALTSSTPLSAQATDTSAEVEPTSIRLMDLNGDDRVDRLESGADGSLVIVLNRGQRQFEDVLQDLPAVVVSDVLVSDLDGDGDTDLYLVSPRDNVALLGDGTGRFVALTAEIGLTDRGLGEAVESLDIDADGIQDILLHNASGDVIFWGTDAGLFERDPSTPPVAIGLEIFASPVRGALDEPKSADRTGVERVGTITFVQGSSAPSGGGSPLGGTRQIVDYPRLQCADAVTDATTGDCIAADSTPTLGSLYPLGPEFNIDPAGRVGIGTSAPTERLSVAGAIESMTGGFVFPDGTQQTSAYEGGGVPSGFMILGETQTPPAGFDATGMSLTLSAGPEGWTTRAAMSAPSYLTAAAALNDKVYLLGGYDGSFLDSVQEYDPVTDAWLPRAPLASPRYGVCSVALNGRIYAIGGYNGSSLSSLEEYDPLTDIWTSKASMPSPRYLAGAAVLNGKIYVAGGSGTSYLSSLEEYDPVTDSWATKAPMSTARSGHGVVAMNGGIYAIGGYSGSYSSSVEEYDPATDSWSARAPMAVARYLTAAAAMNGRIYAVGGFDGTPLSSVEEYDPVTDSWAPKASMSGPRYGLGAVELNGKAYVVGGFGDTSYLSSVEEYETGLLALHLHRRN